MVMNHSAILGMDMDYGCMYICTYVHVYVYQSNWSRKLLANESLIKLARNAARRLRLINAEIGMTDFENIANIRIETGQTD